VSRVISHQNCATLKNPGKRRSQKGLFLFTDAAGCYIRLHGWGMPSSVDPGPKCFYAIETNGFQQLNVTPAPDQQRGIHSLIVDASTCSASDYQHWDTHEFSSESVRLGNYLPTLKTGK